jgi:hypothetical protein
MGNENDISNNNNQRELRKKIKSQSKYLKIH